MLRRTIQVEKRHRDVFFDGADQGLAPISVVITTLTARSYEYCVSQFVYDSELDVVRDIIRHMPDFIEDAQGWWSTALVYLERNDFRREFRREVEQRSKPRGSLLRLACPGIRRPR